MKIKICGLKRAEDIAAVNSAGPDYIGFVFAKNRKRTVSIQTAAELRAMLSPEIKAVGVFLNNDIKEIEKICKDGIIDYVQLHGDEDESFIRELREKTDIPIIKAVSVKTKEDILGADRLPVEYLLFDTYKKGQAGGTGESFDWGMIPQTEKPFFLAGGINEKNICAALETGAYAIDVSSGAETDGVKDPEKITNIVKMVKGT